MSLYDTDNMSLYYLDNREKHDDIIKKFIFNHLKENTIVLLEIYLLCGQ